MKLSRLLNPLKESRNKILHHVVAGVNELIEPADGYYGDFNVDVEYELIPASYSDHPYQDTTAREHHPAEVNIMDLKADDKIQMFDSDDKLIKEFAKGFDIEKLPGFKPKEHLKYFHDKVWEQS